MVITGLTHRRNGVFGAGYYHARLKWRANGKTIVGTAIVFEEPEHVAVYSDCGDSYACEDFENDLRIFIESQAGQQMAFPHLIA
ncbi:MAG: hypothetical protein JJ902_05380 [Roseibium sp.]|nr:hypothetical protein [Roseibium sp.]